MALQNYFAKPTKGLVAQQSNTAINVKLKYLKRNTDTVRAKSMTGGLKIL